MHSIWVICAKSIIAEEHICARAIGNLFTSTCHLNSFNNWHSYVCTSVAKRVNDGQHVQHVVGDAGDGFAIMIFAWFEHIPTTKCGKFVSGIFCPQEQRLVCLICHIHWISLTDFEAFQSHMAQTSKFKVFLVLKALTKYHFLLKDILEQWKKWLIFW